MSEIDNSVITTKKVSGSIAGYICDSPCLKPIIFNPFVLSFAILLVIWLVDLFYGKTFTAGSPSMLFQHMLTTYSIVVSGIVLHDMIIKHYYRVDRYQKKIADQSLDEDQSLDKQEIVEVEFPQIQTTAYI